MSQFMILTVLGRGNGTPNVVHYFRITTSLVTIEAKAVKDPIIEILVLTM